MEISSSCLFKRETTYDEAFNKIEAFFKTFKNIQKSKQKNKSTKSEKKQKGKINLQKKSP